MLCSVDVLLSILFYCAAGVMVNKDEMKVHENFQKPLEKRFRRYLITDDHLFSVLLYLPVT